jgi:hypothetical protein
MNERIFELAKQADLIQWDSLPSGARTPDHESVVKAQKFAQLIVQECDYLIQQQVSLKYKDGWEQSGVSDDWAYGHYAASTLSRTIIKQHFGVKE